MTRPTKATLQQCLRPGFVLSMEDDGGLYTLHLRDEHQNLVGTLSGHLTKGWVLIRELEVVEEMRGRGIGLKMLREVEDLAKAYGCTVCHVNLMFDFSSQGFWEAHGYVALPADKSIMGDIPRVYLSRKLEAAAGELRLAA